MDTKQTYLNDLKERLNEYRKKLSTSRQGSDILSNPLEEALKTAQDSYTDLQSASEEGWGETALKRHKKISLCIG